MLSRLLPDGCDCPMVANAGGFLGSESGFVPCVYFVSVFLSSEFFWCCFDGCDCPTGGFSSEETEYFVCESVLNVWYDNEDGSSCFKDEGC